MVRINLNIKEETMEVADQVKLEPQDQDYAPQEVVLPKIVQVFTAAEPLLCTKCDFKTKSKAVLERHMKSHLLRNQCAQCNFISVKLGTLKLHIESEHYEDISSFGVKWVSCDQCEYAACNKIDLQRHYMEKHVLSCSVCAYCTTKLVTLRYS